MARTVCEELQTIGLRTTGDLKAISKELHILVMQSTSAALWAELCLKFDHRPVADISLQAALDSKCRAACKTFLSEMRDKYT